MAEHGKLSAINECSKSTGVKDAFAEQVITSLLEANDNVKGKNKNCNHLKLKKKDIPAAMAQIRSDLCHSENHLNPLFHLPRELGSDRLFSSLMLYNRPDRLRYFSATTQWCSTRVHAWLCQVHLTNYDEGYPERWPKGSNGYSRSSSCLYGSNTNTGDLGRSCPQC